MPLQISLEDELAKVIEVEREMGKNANEAKRVDFSRSLRLAALRKVKFDLK